MVRSETAWNATAFFCEEVKEVAECEREIQATHRSHRGCPGRQMNSCLHASAVQMTDVRGRRSSLDHPRRWLPKSHNLDRSTQILPGGSAINTKVVKNLTYPPTSPKLKISLEYLTLIMCILFSYKIFYKRRYDTEMLLLFTYVRYGEFETCLIILN